MKDKSTKIVEVRLVYACLAGILQGVALSPGPAVYTAAFQHAKGYAITSATKAIPRQAKQ